MSFTVWVWYPKDWHMAELEHVDEREAFEKAISLSRNVGARIGVVRRITIVNNEDDSTAFEWQFGKGITFPTINLS